MSISTPRVAIPANACDCHVHIFDPARFPYVPQRSYTPGPALVSDLLAFERRIGIERVVLVQPSGYGTDNRCLSDALARLGTLRARGVAVVDPATVNDAELKRLHADGVRAIRLNLEVKGEHSAERTRAALTQALAMVQPLGWAVQIYADLHLVDSVADVLANAATPVVLDHFGGLKAELGLDQPGFSTLLRLLHGSKVHVKLSAPYRASKRPDYADLAPFARALIEAGPQRLVWASDWPHTGSSSKRGGDLSQIEPFRDIDDGRVLELLAEWCPDDLARNHILVDNAARLFQFGD